MQTEFPTQEEQDKVWEYCCKRPLIRPQISIKGMVIKLLSCLVVTGIFSFGFHQIADISFVIIFAFAVVIMICIYSQKIVIGLVELYQYFAPENMRRRCLLMPTCSEYMILAVEKYGVLIGVYKGINRLLNHCRGNVYHIDYP